MKIRVLVIFLLLVAPLMLSCVSARHIRHPRHHNGRLKDVSGGRRGGASDTMQVAGSRLPDCTHACGSCTPCRLVIISFVCSSLEEAETCPIAYKCMCNRKSYPVP
ncbi:hypothetical protein Sjap_025584 [Stephania japonica]|uniref:Epidermal patterning factor-like protein n=1 Tax=Stephania japonica TaxID=461633 RepID=A0AAP0E544_9MAGN